MAATSSQSFGNLLASGFQGFAGGFNKDWNTAFKTPLDSTQTLPVKPEATSGLAGGISGFMTPEFDAIQKIENKDMRTFAMMEYLADRRAQKDVDNLPNTLKTIRDQQYADRLRADPLDFQSLVARTFLTNLKEIPQNIIAARRITQDMYAPPQAGNVQLVNYGASSPRRIF